MTNAKLVYENIKISIISIKSHLLRTILTVMIIAFGIMALVGILTAIDAVEYFLNQNFAMMGSNTFNIQNRDIRVHIGGNRNKARSFKTIDYKQAMDFKEQYNFPVVTSIYTYGTGIATVKYESEKTNPNIQVMGSDENYIATAGLELEKGRPFSSNEVLQGNHVVILGSEVASKLFKENEDPIGKIISIGAGKYKVIGLLAERGSSIGFSGDRSCMVPLANVRQYFSRPNMNFKISVMLTDPQQMDAAIGEATGVFRKIRKDRIGEDDSFSIIKSDNIASMLIGLTSKIQIGATVIGLITLVSAAIGLMNIMLVSVTERTREIGIRKAVGATARTIRNQFLAEAIVIAQIGGLLGIIAGMLIGNMVSYFTESAFIIPWLWIVVGLTLTFIVALVSGIIPANKAAKLDPIESLRYE
ncbi:MAG: ABC transporter permease [Bacteroidetes bacterium]|nr:MAG: ABC transporter permease [Bacteroidota bacterium]